MLINGAGGRGRRKRGCMGFNICLGQKKRGAERAQAYTHLKSLYIILKRTCMDIYSLVIIKLDATCTKFNLTAAVDGKTVSE